MMTAIAILTLVGLLWWAGLLVHHAGKEAQRDHDEAINRAAQGIDPYAEMDAAFEAYVSPPVQDNFSAPAAFRINRERRGSWPHNSERFGGNAHQRRVFRRFVERGCV